MTFPIVVVKSPCVFSGSEFYDFSIAGLVKHGSEDQDTLY